MAFKETKLYSVVACKCPRCHEGDLFPYKAYSRKLTDMHKKCPVCGEDYQREPGFYFGAAYVSYALSVALWVAVFVAMVTFDAIGIIDFKLFDDPAEFFIAGIVALVLLFPMLYRWSRSVWINFFVHYRKDAKEVNNSKAK